MRHWHGRMPLNTCCKLAQSPLWPFTFRQQEDQQLPLRLGDICRIFPVRMIFVLSFQGDLHPNLDR